MKFADKPNKKYLKSFDYVTPNTLRNVEHIEMIYLENGKPKTNDTYFKKVNGEFAMRTQDDMFNTPKNKRDKESAKAILEYFKSLDKPIAFSDMINYLKSKYEYYYSRYNGDVSIEFLKDNGDSFYICDKPNWLLCYDAFSLNGYESKPKRKSGLCQLENSVRKMW